MRNAGKTTVTMHSAVPAALAASLGLTGGQNTAGQVLVLRHGDALALVTSGHAAFGSAARDAALAPTAIASVLTHAI